MLILISNDDGVHSEGLQVLRRALQKIAEVVVVAPDREQSASSHALTLHTPLRIYPLQKSIYAVNGTPSDCVSLGVYQILKRKPDLVFSGINKGANLGDDVHYSGTVAAALEGAMMGIPSVAISLTAKKNFIFSVAASFALRVAKKIHPKGLPKGLMLNINVPNLPASKIRGSVWTKIGKRNYGGMIIEKHDPRGVPYYWIGGDQEAFEPLSGSDCNAVLENKISITPLKVDITHHGALRAFKNWKF